MDIESYFLHKESPIQEALSTLEKNDVKIVLVVNEEKHLLGTITDGDIRRAMLGGRAFTDPVEAIMATNPITINHQAPLADIVEIMEEKRIQQIILVDDHGKPCEVRSEEDLTPHSVRKENWVVLMAGGLGSRLGPLTENTPKPMLTVGGSPILEILINHFKKLGFYKFYICVNYKAQVIRDYFGKGEQHGIRIRYIEEEERLDTAGALSLIKKKPHLPLFVVNGDIVTSLNFDDMLNFHTEHNAMATMAIREHSQQVPYGVVEIQDYKIHDFVEKPVHKHFINAGIYLLDPGLLKLLKEREPCTMPTLFERAKEGGLATYAFPISEYWMDIGQPDDYHKVNNDYVTQDVSTE